jgi:corrinoid protein of di/trimethylamine methyltransferase
MTEKENLISAMKSGDIASSVEMTKKVLKKGIPAAEVVDSLIKAVREVGEAFEKFDIFLPEMMMASNAMVEIMKILEPKLKEESPSTKMKFAKIIMATVKGDIHEIGKDIVILLLRANRFDVVDMGADVDSLEIVKAAEREKADLIGLSALMTTTMLGQKEVIEILKEMKLRNKFKVIIGGAPTTQDWASRIGADAWAKDAASAIMIAEKLINRKGVN